MLGIMLTPLWTREKREGNSDRENINALVSFRPKKLHQLTTNKPNLSLRLHTYALSVSNVG